MPREMAGHAASELKCVARVVHVEPNAFLGGKAGIGLHIEQYQARAAAKMEAETGVGVGVGAGAGMGAGKEPWAS